MVEQDAVALARLELLSNTAMLKKVLDRKSERKGDKNEEKTFNIVQAPHQKTPSTLSIASHPLAHGEKNQRRESPSPRTILDSSRDAPPMFHERLGHAAFVPPHFSYNRGDVDSLRAPPSHTEGRAYQGNATFQRGFIQGAHGDMYYRDNCNIAAAGTSQMASRQHPSGGMAPYTVNENLHRPHYLGTTMYNGRALTDTRHEPVYHPPPRVATFEDHEDSRSSSYEVLARENHHLREQLTEKDRVLSSLQEKVNYLEKQIGELRQVSNSPVILSWTHEHTSDIAFNPFFPF